MRMARCWPSLILLIYAYSTHANASTILSSELTNFIPECAQTCFISFLDANFPTSTCSSIPTLDCLCSHNSTTGYTVGEGAVQCIFSEDMIRLCNGADAQNAVVQDAYSMCNDQDNALPNTHATIVATLVEQSSMPSVFLVSPATTTAVPISTLPTSTQPTSTSIALISTSSSMISSSLDSTTSSDPITSSGSTISSTTTSSIRTVFSSSNPVTASGSPTLFPIATKPSPVASASASASASTSASSTATPAPAPTLTKPQVIGITVASVGVGALGLGLLLILACWKRRKARRERDSDLLPFQSAPSNYISYSNYTKSTKSSKKFGFSPFRPAGRKEIGPGATSNGVAAKIPPRVPPRLDTQSPNMFSRRSLKPDSIGIAISPENQRQRQRTSKLLPERPILTLQTPPRTANNPGVGPSNLSFSRPALAPAPAPAPRQSTTTQFEEDEESATTGGARDTWGQADADEQLETAIGNWQTVRNVNPNPPPAAFFVTGGDGNHWRQARDSSNNPNVPEYYVKPLNIQRGIGSFSQPRRPDEYPRPRQQSSSPLNAFPAPPRSNQYPPRLQIPTGPTTATSSVYSTGTPSLPAGAPSPISRQQKKYKQVGPYDGHKSTGSMTSFESSDSILNTPTPKTPRTADNPLSPVAELESPTPGRSPVSYPKIPKLGRLPESTIRLVPPPPQPDFGSVMAKPHQPWRAAELEAARRRREEQLDAQQEAVYETQPQAQSQSPRPHVGSQYQERRKDTEPQDQERRKSLIELQLPLQAPHLQYPERTSSRSRHNAAIPPSSSGLNTLPSQHEHFQSPVPRAPGFGLPVGPRPKRLPGPGQQPVNTQPPITFTRSSSALSHISEGSSNTSNVSLLAKRRGEQKAAALTLNDASSGGGGSKGSKWRVLKEGDIEAAKSPGWRPMLSSQHHGNQGSVNVNANAGRGGYGDGQQTRVLQSMEPVELPGTPGWVPRLTPTRRGDELFISVQ